MAPPAALHSGNPPADTSGTIGCTTISWASALSSVSAQNFALPMSSCAAPSSKPLESPATNGGGAASLGPGAGVSGKTTESGPSSQDKADAASATHAQHDTRFRMSDLVFHRSLPTGI